MSTDAYDRLEAELRRRLEGNLFGEPLAVTPVLDATARVRLTATVWARARIERTRVKGYAPRGETAQSVLHARAALAPEADKAVAAWSFAEDLRAQATADPWRVLGAAQGAVDGPELDARRCVLHRCEDCAGAGGFSCSRCAGSGRTKCQSCHGSGVVDAECTVCKSSETQGLKLPVWDDAAGSFRLTQHGATSCQACRGAGAVRETCGRCHGGGEEMCGLCAGHGRVLCETCDGHGGLTDQFAAGLSIEHTVHLALVSPEPSPEVERALRAGYAGLAATRAFDPELIDFSSSDLGHRIIYEADIAVASARVAIGARSPRLIFDVAGVGDPVKLIDPPKILDAVLERRLDAVAVGGANAFDDTRKAVADGLAEASMGRRALAAAARREARVDLSDLSPLLSDRAAERLFRLAGTAHLAVGWRARTWLWPAAALSAPILAAVMIGVGFDGVIRGPVTQAFAAGDAGAVPAPAGVAAIVGGVLPFLAFWFAWLALAGRVFRRSTRRVLGMSRDLTVGDVLASGVGPWAALIVGGALYSMIFFSGVGAAAPAGPVAPAGTAATTLDGQATAEALEIEPPADQEIAGAPAQEPDDTRSAETAASIETAPTASAALDWRLRATARRWRSIDGAAAIVASDGGAALRIACVNGAAQLALLIDDAPETARVVFTVDGVAPVVSTAQAVPGGLGWPASFSDAMRLRRGNSVRIAVDLPDGRRAFGFRLTGSNAAVRDAVRGCSF